MASPSARLSFLVEAKTRTAVGELRKFSSTVDKTAANTKHLSTAQTAAARALRASGASYKEIASKMGTTDTAIRKLIADGKKQSTTMGKMGSAAKSASKNTDKLERSTHKLGSSMKTAAKYAAGAVVAYVGISQAKEAVTVTEELAKTTKGLVANLGLGAKEASEWAVVTKVRAGDTKKLTLGFKTFAGQINAARQGSSASLESFKRLGFTQADLVKSSHNFHFALGKVAEGLHSMGTGTDKLQISSKLFGKAWETLQPVLRDGRKSLQENLDTADEMGATFGGKSLDSINDLVAATRRSEIAQIGLQIAFTENVAPALTSVMTGIGNFIHEMRTGEGVGGKFADAMKAVGTGISWTVDQIEVAVEWVRDHWGNAITDAAQWTAQAAKTIAAAVAAAFGPTVQWITNAAGNVAHAFGVMIHWVSGVVNSFVDFYNQSKYLQTWFTVVKTYVLLVAGLWKTVLVAAFHFAFNVIKRILPAIEQFLKGFAQVVKGIVEVISGILTLKFGRVWNGVKNIFSGALKEIIALMRAWSAPLREVLGFIGGVLKKAFEGVWNGVTGVFTDAKEKIIDVLEVIIDAINLIPGVPDIGNIRGGGSSGVQTKSRGSAGTGRGSAGDRSARGRNAAYARGGSVHQPMAIVGEEAPRHPEWVIATNPRYKQNNLRYWAQAGHDLGVPGFFSGGSALGKVTGAVGDVAGAVGGKILNTAGAAVGALPTPHLPDIVAGLGPYLISKVTDWIKSGFSSGKLGTVSGPGAAKGPKGVGSYKGVPMANWVIESLEYAAAHGASPQPTSGYRSHKQNEEEGRFYKSEHEGTRYPYGAVDFGSYTTGLAEKLSVVAATGSFKYPLLAPIGFSDAGHASGTGHRKGGLAFLKGGGKLPGWVHGTKTLDADQLASLAAYVGAANPALMGQYAMGESSGNPRTVGGEGERGLWQILGSTAANYGLDWNRMFDPLYNAQSMKVVLDSEGTGAWHASPTGPKGNITSLGAAGGGGSASARAARRKKIREHQKAGLQGAVKGKMVKGKKGKWGWKGAAPKTHARTVAQFPGMKAGVIPKALAGLAPGLTSLFTGPGMTGEQRFTASEHALEVAGETGDTADDRAIYQYQRGVSEKRKEAIKKQLRAINKRLAQPLSPKQKKILLARRDALTGELSTVQGRIGAAREGIKGLDEVEPDEAAEKAVEAQEANTAAMVELAQTQRELKETLEETMHLSETAMATGSAEAWRALADKLSGNLGARVLTSSRAVGFGSPGRT